MPTAVFQATLQTYKPLFDTQYLTLNTLNALCMQWKYKANFKGQGNASSSGVSRSNPEGKYIKEKSNFVVGLM